MTMKSIRPSASVKYDNTGRVVVVTGGAQGIGRAIVEEFAQSGASVVCFDLQQLAAADCPPRVVYIRGDVASEEDCRGVIESTLKQFGGLDVLVNNAAIQPPASYVPVHQLEKSAWDRMIAVNFSGYYLMTKHAVPVMLRQRSGVIVNLASGQGHRTTRSVPAYGPIKAANLMQTMQWGVEYAREGLRVVSVSPGAIKYAAGAGVAGRTRR
jgi:3-oxoacyl-[acyl-carrier protein] reductase